MLDEVFFLGARADAALSAAGLMAVDIHRRAFDVARVADGNQHFGIGDQVFELDFVDLVYDLRAPVVAVFLLYFFQLADDHGLQLFLAGQDFFQLGDAVADGLQFFDDFVDGELRQAMQLQFENGVHLNGREAPGDGARRLAFHAAKIVSPAVQLDAGDFAGLSVFRDRGVLLREEVQQVLLGVGAARRPTNDANHIVHIIEGDLIADQNVLAFAGFAQFVARAAQHDVAAVLDEQADELEQPHLFRLPTGDGQQDHAERFLHLRVLVEIVEDELRFFAALELDDDAHAFAVAFVAHVRNAVNLLILRQLGNALDERGFVHLVGDFGDDDVLAVLGDFFDGGLRAHGEAAAPGFVCRLDAFAAGNVAASREVRPGDDLEHFFERSVRLLDHQHGGIDDFAQVVRRNVGSHTHSDAARTVDQEIRHARGQNGRLFFRFVEIRGEVDGFFLDVREEFFGNSRKARFRVPHRRRHVAVHGAEVALAVHQRIAHVEVLGHADQRVVHRRVAVRVIFAEDFADDLRAFAVGARGSQTQLIHAEKNAPVHGLQAIAHVGERAPDDHAHRVVE